MIKRRFIFLGVITLVLVSCGLKRALTPEEKKLAGVSELSEVASDGTPYSKLDNPQARFGEDVVRDPSLHDDPKNNKEIIPTPSNGKAQEYSYKDANGVIISKKNGMLVTEMPNGEKYYLPDEL